MNRHFLALAGALLALSSCSSPAALLSPDSEETGAVCTPVGEDGTAAIAFDLMRNISTGPVRIVSVELSSPTDLELVANGASTDLGSAHVGGGPSVASDSVSDRLVLAPEETAVIEVVLAPSQGSEYGWTNGLWVLAESESGQLVRHHTCHALLVSTSGPCVAVDQPSVPENLDRMCGRSEDA